MSTAVATKIVLGTETAGDLTTKEERWVACLDLWLARSEAESVCIHPEPKEKAMQDRSEGYPKGTAGKFFTFAVFVRFCKK